MAERLISVAMCTYNGVLYLKEQLESILNQSYTNFELIVLDDHSSDQTYGLLKEFQSADARIKLYRNDVNLGYNANFEKVLTYCTADLIAFSDQDDVWNKDKLRKMEALIGSNLLLYHNSSFMDERGRLTGKTMLSGHRFVKGNSSHYFLYNNCVSGHSCLIHKDLLKLIPPFPENFYYDWWLAYTAACTGRIDFTTEALVNYRLHGQSITQLFKKTMRDARIRNLSLFLAHRLTPARAGSLLAGLLEGYRELLSKKFSYTLFLLLYRHYKDFFHTRKRSFYSNFKFILEESTR